MRVRFDGQLGQRAYGSGCQTGRALIPRAGTAVDLIERTEELQRTGTRTTQPQARALGIRLNLRNKQNAHPQNQIAPLSVQSAPLCPLRVNANWIE